MSVSTLTTTATSGISNQYRNYFEPKLLDHAIQEVRLNEFAMQESLPKNLGSKVVSFFRPQVADSANVRTLVEGTPVSTSEYTQISLTKIDVTLGQIGEVFAMTDILGYTDLFNSLKNGVTLMGEDCALKADDITRNVLADASTGGTKRYAQGTADWTTLAAASTSAAKLVGTDFLDAVTRLKVNRAPKIGGGYVGIVPPQVSRDLMNDSDWLKASQYSKVDQLFKGEAGTYYGVRVVEATNPFREAVLGAEGTFSATGGIYMSVITGKNAYGVSKLAGGSPFSPQIVICDKADKSDPLNQKMTAGWKAFYNSVVLNQAWAISLRSQTAFTS